MVTVCGEFAAPGAVIVTRPLAEMPLTVTVCFCPLSSEPLCGERLYEVGDAVALQVMTPSPPLVTVNVVLAPRHKNRPTEDGVTANADCSGDGVIVAVTVVVTVASG